MCTLMWVPTFGTFVGAVAVVSVLSVILLGSQLLAFLMRLPW